jgi:hypothetical protein
MEHVIIYYLHKGDDVPFYVGKTKSNLFTRLNAHKLRKQENKLFIVEIDNVYLNDWKFWEEWYIRLFKSWGFKLENKNNGGGGVEFHTIESKIKISKARIGKPGPYKGKKRPKGFGEQISNNKERSVKISKSSIGMSKSHKGKLFTEEHKKKIKDTRGFLKTRKNTWQDTPVIQYSICGDFIKEWLSQKEATIFLGKNGDGIGACCRGRQKKAYGFVWKFKN